MNLLRLPEESEAKVHELRDLCKQHPVYIPLPKVAAFLETDAESLRCSIEQGKCPFGLSWHKDSKGNRAFKIPSATFFLWYTQGYGYRDAG